MGAFSFSYICFMAKTFGANTQVVYQTLQDLVNKDQQGFVTELEFNRFAQIAQLKIFNRLFDELKDAQKISRSGVGTFRDKSRTKRILEDLAAFSTRQLIQRTDVQDSEDEIVDQYFDLTALTDSDSMARIISISTGGGFVLDQSTKRPIEICYDEEKIERILRNNLSAPSEEIPIALVSDNIHVFPTSISEIEVRYYKYPTSRDQDGNRTPLQPYYDGNVNSTAIRNFELPEHYTSDLIYEMAKLIGVNLRDRDIIEQTGQEMLTRKQETL